MAPVPARIWTIRWVSAACPCTNGCSRPARFRRCSATTAARPASTTTLPRAAWKGSAPGSSAATCSVRSAGPGRTMRGRAGGATTRPITRRCSCSRITPGRRSRWRAARRSILSPTASTPRSQRAKDAAGARDVRVGGGAATIRQYLKAGLVDEMHLAISPVLLGRGESLLADLDLVRLGYRCSEHSSSAAAMHVVLTKA